MKEELIVNIRVPSKLNVSMQNGTPLNVGLQPGTGTNYNKLFNKPAINGVELVGNLISHDLHIISEDTTDGWNSKRDYVPKLGEIVLYTDRDTITDEHGNAMRVPGIKIGDGEAYVVDLPFQDEAMRKDILDKLRQHAEDKTIHVTPQEKAFWNAKLNCNVTGEELSFTRL